jgi:DNA-binding ferritin-like protein
MKKLATHLRCMQLYTHNAHNMCKGDTFYADHETLGELYPVYEAAYDGVVERMIGLGKEIDLASVQKEAADMCSQKGVATSFSDAFKNILECEKELCKVLDEANEGASLGTQNFVQGLADQSEMRQYQLQQRTGSSPSASAPEKEEKKEAQVSVETDKKEKSKEVKSASFKLLSAVK